MVEQWALHTRRSLARHTTIWLGENASEFGETASVPGQRMEVWISVEKALGAVGGLRVNIEETKRAREQEDHGALAEEGVPPITPPNCCDRSSCRLGELNGHSNRGRSAREPQSAGASSRHEGQGDYPCGRRRERTKWRNACGGIPITLLNARSNVRTDWKPVASASSAIEQYRPLRIMQALCTRQSFIH